ncbi:hypothetical protein B0J18DRAFT_485081 [Chaetomium sp. MPI-SDFR-AT-0129]|nr:hypothetical protein B0J18DRAFT_485081 [Chaetomium sp. MPI-SDFR-AT-0129]
MKFTFIASAIALLAGSALASPTPTTPIITPLPTPTPPSPCKTYTTTTSYAHEMCPMYCVTPDSPICPKYPCPAIPTGACPSGQTITRLPQLPATTIVSTVTGTPTAAGEAVCTVTVQAEVGCAVCGCLGCEVCAKKTGA